jgi:hypothetical protein
LPHKSVVFASRPEVGGIAEALLKPVVLVVADAFVLRFELGGCVENRLPLVAFGCVIPDLIDEST